MEGKVLKLYVKTGPEAVEARLVAYDEQGREVAEREYKGLKQIVIDARALISPQVRGEPLVVAVESARARVDKGVLRVEGRG